MNPETSWADDLLTGTIWLGFGLLAAGLSMQLDIGSVDAPGPGFVPFWISVFLAACAVVLVVATLHRGRTAEDHPQWSSLFPTRVLVFLAALGLYLTTMRYLGFFLGSTLLLAVLFGLTQPMRWYWRIGSALVSVAVFWLIFSRLLGLDLPAGRIFGS